MTDASASLSLRHSRLPHVTSLAISPPYRSRQIDLPKLRTSLDWQDLFISSKVDPEIPLGQLYLKIITSCNTASSGGMPLIILPPCQP
jgi:hypothetical protein